MTESIAIAGTITVSNGPRIPINRTITVKAYDKIDVTVPTGGAPEIVELLPSASDTLKFFLVVSSYYGDDLSYTINEGATDYKLDQPHIFTGVGAILLLDVNPQKLVITNNSSEDAQIQILLGRDT